MSHAPDVGGVKAEPNLTPLLDLVLQLLMFFVMTVNFVSTEVRDDVKLPVAQSARPMDKSLDKVLMVNMDAKGRLFILGLDRPLTNPGEIGYFLRKEFSDAQLLAKARGDKAGEVKTAVIIRADQDVKYEKVYQLLRSCKEAGYKSMQLRATVRGG
jgi:biopolymer transport protein ExbD